MKTIGIAFAGLGSRGKDAYLPAFTALEDVKVEVVAIADIDRSKVDEVAKKYGVPHDRCFNSDEEMLKQPKLGDAICIATMDRQHVPQAITALKKGYHLLLEKPISPEISECHELCKVAKEAQRHVIVCHVLRYTPFYRTLKAQVDSGIIGDIVTVQALENVGYWHQAHSFVRGNWRNSDQTSPMILQKSCHDMDILMWVTGKRCKSLSSFGSTWYFNAEHAPSGAADRCTGGCKARVQCPYDAEKIYMDHPRIGVRNGHKTWPLDVLSLNPTEETIKKAIDEGPYGRCVFHCDNNVVDHQVVNMLMEDNSTFGFTMTGFNASGSRYTKLMGTKGEILAEMDKKLITVTPFGEAPIVIDVGALQKTTTGHGGGDGGICSEFARLIAGEPTDGGLTWLDESLESHYMALAAEQSRLENGRVVEMNEFRHE